MNIDILGSCVTRDVLRFDNPFSLGRYYARTSISSIYSEPIHIDLNKINLPSEFQKRMIYFDLTNDFRNYIKYTKSKILVLDFIDERFNLMQLQNSFFTRSNEFLKSNLNDQLNASPINNSLKFDLWNKKLPQFLNEVLTYYDFIVLHKAFWQEYYYDENGDLKKFENQPIQKKNNELKNYYKAIESAKNDLNVIELKNYHASSKHMWGLSPYHYEDDYYKEFINRLQRIVE